MDSNKKINHSTPSKRILHNMQEKYGRDTCDSPFKLSENYQTPPNTSKFAKVKNPFEAAIFYGKLQTHYLSPSVFVKPSNIKQEEDFKWTIDELSDLKPAHIEDDVQFESPERDSDLESLAQSRIDKFFSMKEIIPSPYTQPVQKCPLIKDLESINSPVQSLKTTIDSSAQTVLTLPPILPKELENMLTPYFTYTQDQQQHEVQFNNSMYHRLFERHRESEDSAESSPSNPINLNLSPVLLSHLDGRTTTPQRDIIEDCILSPIVGEDVGKRLSTRLNFSSYHMSVDTSIDVPDIEILSQKNDSLVLDAAKSPVPDLLNDSSTHWDVEYKNFAYPNSNSSTDEMDVSNSNTPKSRVISSQRKNLSDSFNKEVESDDAEVCVMMTPIETLSGSNYSDVGYQTGCISEESSSFRKSTNLFASTPTKLKLFK